tara:strand:+ start:1231 stop:1392 length:162 start_codon:yes stop_codon:yes gene_type:complete
MFAMPNRTQYSENKGNISECVLLRVDTAAAAAAAAAITTTTTSTIVLIDPPLS